MAYFDYNMSSSSTTSSDGDDSTCWSRSVSAYDRTTPPPPPKSILVGSLRHEGAHIHSLALKDGFLYTGSGSKNIRVWKDMQEFSTFKSGSGFVKAIVISGDRIFTGHQDGRIRVWKMTNGGASHEQVGILPAFLDEFKGSISPKNYVKSKRNGTAQQIKHSEAVSCLSMSEEGGLLYSSSWDRTFKVWDINTSKCIESVTAHDDAVNAIVASPDGLVYTGSADGTMKVWRREPAVVRHFLWQTLLRQDSAVTSLAIGEKGSLVYCGSSDGFLNFWLVKKKEISHRRCLKGHKLAVLCIAVEGNLVLTGAADKNITVWSRARGMHECVTVLSGHTAPVKCLVVEADEGDGDGDGGEDRKWKVYSGSLDNSVKVWSVTETLPKLRNVNSDQFDGWQRNPFFDPVLG